MDGCLGWEDPLEEEMATHSSIFAMKIPWTEEPAVLWSVGLLRVRQKRLSIHASLYIIFFSYQLGKSKH